MRYEQTILSMGQYAACRLVCFCFFVGFVLFFLFLTVPLTPFAFLASSRFETVGDWFRISGEKVQLHHYAVSGWFAFMFVIILN